MLSEQELERRWQDLTFTDDFIFSRVMHDEEICRQVVELIRKQYEKAMAILRADEKQLHRLAQHLYQQETITGERFMQLLEEGVADRTSAT